MDKPDDGTTITFFSTSQGLTTGVLHFGSYSGANDAKVSTYLTNVATIVLTITSANNAYLPYVPNTFTHSFGTSDVPDGKIRVNGTVTVSGNQASAPSTGNSTYNLALMADATGLEPLPGRYYGHIDVNKILSAEEISSIQARYRSKLNLAA